MKEFIFLKLGSSNCLADYWLSNDNILGFQAAAIYFGICTAEDIEELYMYIKNGKIHKLKSKWKKEDKWKSGCDYLFKQRKQIKSFLDGVYNRDIFITITPQKIYFYKPKGKIEDFPKNKFREYNNELERWKKKYRNLSNAINGMKITKKDHRWDHFPKYVQVDIIKELDNTKDIPFILRSFPSNQRYNRKTCSKIEDRGVINAIRYCLYRTPIEPKNEVELLESLSPLEFETLAFLILTEAGLHVYAWRGGTLQGIDIVAKNFSEEEIDLDEVHVKPGEIKSFQIKRIRNYNKEVPTEIDYVITLTSNNSNYLTAGWIIRQINKLAIKKANKNESSTVVGWLKKSLWWISEDAIHRYLEL